MNGGAENIFDGLPIESCGHFIAMSNELLLAYVRSEESYCAQCGRIVDVWASVTSCFVGAGATFSLLAPLGGLTLARELKLETSTIVDLDFDTLGVPADATLRSVNLTGAGPGLVIPSFILGNEPRLARLPHHMGVYLVPMGANAPQIATFNLHVQYIPRQTAVHRDLLVGAAMAHGDNDFARAVIDAHTAADTALLSALSHRTQGLISQHSRIGFREKIGVAESLRNERGLPPLPSPLREASARLNVSRNNVAHPPKTSTGVSQHEVAQLLAASLFLVALAESNLGLDAPGPSATG